MKAGITVVLIVLAIIGGTWWYRRDMPVTTSEEITSAYGTDSASPLPSNSSTSTMPNDTTTVSENHSLATFSTSMGDFQIELYDSEMPITTGNFIKLAGEGFYNQTKFHRVIKDFMVQGGDPQSADDSLMMRWGTGGPGYAIADEHKVFDGYSNSRGTISMANSGPESGGSQFFINVVDNPYLDFDKQPSSAKHPVFGRVVSGMEVVDAISTVPVGEASRPLEPVVINSITITHHDKTNQ